MSLRVESAILRDGAVADERGAAERRERHVEFDVPDDAERLRDVARGLDLARMHLAVPDRQRVELVPVGAAPSRPPCTSRARR